MAPFFGLNPILKGINITTFELTSVYVPMSLFNDVLDSVKNFNNQFRSLQTAINEAGVLQFVSDVISLRHHIC